jgi:hypothetical protein
MITDAERRAFFEGLQDWGIQGSNILQPTEEVIAATRHEAPRRTTT